MKRRTFIQTTSSALLAAGTLARISEGSETVVKGKFDISVAAWSWHKMLFAGEVKQIDQPRLAREAGAKGLELVNAFFPSPQYDYLLELMKVADSEGIKILLIMCDSEGNMSSPDFRERRQAVINHKKWLDIAAVLGCHSIRCNSGHQDDPVEGMKMAADSFNELCAYARQYGLNVIIENHGGFSSDSKWLCGLMDMVGVDNFGTLPDFGNFPPETDRYAAVKDLMKYAKAVSAKCWDFGPDGQETKIDFAKMMQIVFDAGYHKFVGVEFEGDRMSEMDGTAAGVKLLKTFQE